MNDESQASAPFSQPKESIVEPDRDARMWGMLAHMSGIIAGVLSGFLLAFLGPLIIWLVKKETSPFVEDQAKEALNFQLAVLIAVFIAWAITLVTCGTGAPLIAVVGIGQIVFAIIAAIKAHEGNLYRYPFTIRFVK